MAGIGVFPGSKEKEEVSWLQSFLKFLKVPVLIGLSLSFIALCNQVLCTLMPNHTAMTSFYHVISTLFQKISPAFLSALWFSPSPWIALLASTLVLSAIVGLQYFLYKRITGKDNSESAENFAKTYFLHAIVSTLFIPMIAQSLMLVASIFKFIFSLIGLPSFLVSTLYWATVPALFLGAGYLVYNFLSEKQKVKEGTTWTDILSFALGLAVSYGLSLYFPIRIRVTELPMTLMSFLKTFTPQVISSFGRRVTVAHISSLFVAVVNLGNGVFRGLFSSYTLAKPQAPSDSLANPLRGNSVLDDAGPRTSLRSDNESNLADQSYIESKMSQG